MDLSTEVMKFDLTTEAERITRFLQAQAADLKREGAVIGLSGGVDSALAATLCVRAFGAERVLGLALPERESNPVSLPLALEQAERLGIRCEVKEITPVVEACGAYARRDEAVRSVVPEHTPECRIKLTLPPDLLERDAYNLFTLTVTGPGGLTRSVRLPKPALLGIVAATNLKLRARMLHLYLEAERSNSFVCGTTNRSESLLGYFVKYGDGGVDVEPLAHLYKTQVYALAEHLQVVRGTLERAPSPDTFGIPVSDQEFYTRLPYPTLDLLLYAWEHHWDEAKVGSAMGLTLDQVRRAFRDISGKHRATRHQRRMPAELGPVGPADPGEGA